MWSVWFQGRDDRPCLFICGVIDLVTARQIADNLMDEGFVGYAWLEKD